MLNLYLKLQKLRYNNKFEYTISIKDESKKVDAIIPASIIQTLFENTIEYAMFSQHKNETLNINFEILDKTVLLKIEYEYYEVADTIKYEPKYRQRVMQWEDHIKLLNSVKNYTIEKEVSLNTERNKHFGEITLTLPDLS